MNQPASLLIVGASGRAAAASAIRAGFRPFVIDLFADEDTAQLGPVLRCPREDYPHGFIELAKEAPPGPWIYTGGLENDPEVIAAISATRELWGNGPAALKRVRDPFELSKWVPMPAMKRMREGLDPAKRWLRKSFQSSGGIGVQPLSTLTAEPDDDWYFQEFETGVPASALFLGPGEILGYCTQLIGEPWLHAPHFRYCGNIGPLPSDRALTARLERIGVALRPLGLRGLFGIDFVQRVDEILVLEVNPRYTASVELYERALGRSLLHEHGRGFEPSLPNPVSEQVRPDQKIHGKAILYADRTFAVPADRPWRGADFADIPTVGSVIEKGQPVVTLFASADTESECRERLKQLARASELP